MGEVNPNRIYAGLKIETTAGTKETLVEADFNVIELDVELPQYQQDHSPVGKGSDGTLINPAKSYSRTRGATNAVKVEMKGSATPTVKPNWFKYPEVGAWKSGVVESGVNDNFEIYYDGKPNCLTATREVRAIACDGANYVKAIKGGIITSSKITCEGVGAPLVFSGDFSGAMVTPTDDTEDFAVTDDAGDCLQPIGSVFLLGGTAYNVTKFEYNVNNTGSIVTDHSDDSLIGYVRNGEGEPTFTFSAIPLGDEVADYTSLFANTDEGTWTDETDDYKLIVTDIQFTDIQDTNESGVLVQDKTCKCGSARFQLK